MGEVLAISGLGQRFAEPLSAGQERTLKRAVAKLVLWGEQVGVSPDQMIVLLESGLTVSELLQYMAERTSNPV